MPGIAADEQGRVPKWIVVAGRCGGRVRNGEGEALIRDGFTGVFVPPVGVKVVCFARICRQGRAAILSGKVAGRRRCVCAVR